MIRFKEFLGELTAQKLSRYIRSAALDQFKDEDLLYNRRKKHVPRDAEDKTLTRKVRNRVGGQQKAANSLWPGSANIVDRKYPGASWHHKGVFDHTEQKGKLLKK